MPPKAKFRKEEITAAALDIVRRSGIEGLTARALGVELKSSSCPIFTVFENMEEVQKSVFSAASELYKSYVDKGLLSSPAFKGVGLAYIRFASEEPKLFRLLFMSERELIPDIENVLPIIDGSYDKILSSVMDGYGLSEPRAERLYRHLWIYTHGIATLCATNTCRFAQSDTERMLTEVFVSLLKSEKGGAE